MDQYIIFLTLTRETFLEDATPDELAIVDRHFEYLQGELARGRLMLAGRCLDGPPGIVVFEADSAEAAREMMENDPAVQAGIFQAELRPYRVALMRSA